MDRNTEYVSILPQKQNFRPGCRNFPNVPRIYYFIRGPSVLDTLYQISQILLNQLVFLWEISLRMSLRNSTGYISHILPYIRTTIIKNIDNDRFIKISSDGSINDISFNDNRFLTVVPCDTNMQLFMRKYIDILNQSLML